MFLFTSLEKPRSAPAPVAARPVETALRNAAAGEGIAFDYLLRTATRESGLKPNAAAPTSSARGLFQFIEQTWLGLVRSEGARQGLGAEAAAIELRGRGSYRVADPSMRSRILALREDPDLAARFAAILTRRNHAALAAALGREPRQGDLYAAHFLGPAGAARLILNAERAPEQSAAALFPAAARANRAIFYDRNGGERSAAEVYRRLVRGFDGKGTAVANVAPAAAPEPGAAPSNRFHGLFRSLERAVAPSVRQGWLNRSETGAPLKITAGQGDRESNA